MMQEERLQKIISQAGIASRRAAEKMILEGRVRVDGQVVRELGTKVDPAAHTILVDGKKIAGEEQHVYLLLSRRGISRRRRTTAGAARYSTCCRRSASASIRSAASTTTRRACCSSRTTVL